MFKVQSSKCIHIYSLNCLELLGLEYMLGVEAHYIHRGMGL